MAASPLMVERRGSSGFRFDNDSSCADQITQRYTRGRVIYLRNPADFHTHAPHEFNKDTLVVIDYCSPPNTHVDEKYFTFQQLAAADVILLSTGRLRILDQSRVVDPFHQMRFKRRIMLHADHCTPAMIQGMSRFTRRSSVWLASTNLYKNLGNTFRSEDQSDYAKLVQFGMLAFAKDTRIFASVSRQIGELYEVNLRITSDDLGEDLTTKESCLVYVLKHLRDNCMNMDRAVALFPSECVASDVRCPVCYEDWKDTLEMPRTSLQCDHTFHAECIASLDKCPICRATMRGSRFDDEQEARKRYVLKRRREEGK